jgi:hypothetical protein
VVSRVVPIVDPVEPVPLVEPEVDPVVLLPVVDPVVPVEPRVVPVPVEPLVVPWPIVESRDGLVLPVEPVPVVLLPVEPVALLPVDPVELLPLGLVLDEEAGGVPGPCVCFGSVLLVPPPAAPPPVCANARPAAMARATDVATRVCFFMEGSVSE